MFHKRSLSNGFILFSQILVSLNIDASGFISPTSVAASLLKLHKSIYGLFNLDFFYAEYLSFCFWLNSSARLDILAFKYVTIVYILILMMLVIWYMNKCHRGTEYLAKFCRFSAIKASITHGISALFILCSSQCLNVSLKLLRGYRLTTREGSDLTVNKVWLNGNIIYFSRKHLPYALPALFCLLIIGLFPLIFLLVYPLLCKVVSWLGYGESKLVNFNTQ